MKLIKIGVIINTSGKFGELVLDVTPNGLLLKSDTEIYIGYSENFTEKYFLNDDIICDKNKIKVSIRDVDSMEDASRFKEKAIFVWREIIKKFNPDLILESDVIGCNVIDIVDNKTIGKIVEVWYLPANDVWLMEFENGELPLPVIDDVVKKVDIENRNIYVNMIDGLWDIAQKI